MRKIVHFLTEHLFDYAGLFPPANLPLHDALKNYFIYQDHEYKELLGKFILPIKKREEYLALTKNHTKKIPLSIILSSIQSLEDIEISLKNDVIKIRSIFEEQPCSELQSFEAAFPAAFYHQTSDELLDHFYNIFKILSPALESSNKSIEELEFFCEVPYLEEEILESFLIFIRKFNERIDTGKIFIKLRAGGITPDLVPSINTLSNFFILLGEYQLPFKMTAGLHIPVPNFNEKVGTTMHGYLNVLFASMISFYKNREGFNRANKSISYDLIAAILKSLHYSDLQVESDSLILTVPYDSETKFLFTSDMIKDFRRNYFKGIGTCDFIEPIEYLNNAIPFL